MSALGSIIVHGADVPIDAVTHTWVEHGLHFTCATRSETRALMLHWTGAENPPRSVFRNMRDGRDEYGRPAPRSVPFVVDQMGEVWQFCDADARAWHARGMGANGWSCGIEIVNVGHGDASKSPYRIERERRTDVIHGRLVRYLYFTAAQVATVLELTRVLCDVYGLPWRVPEKNGDVLSGVMPKSYAERVRGVCGHYMVEPGKYDPAPQLMREIWRRGTPAHEPPRVA